MSNVTHDHTTGGIGEILLDQIQDCFSTSEEFLDDGMVVVKKFDRERAKYLIEEFANRLAVGKCG